MGENEVEPRLDYFPPRPPMTPEQQAALDRYCTEALAEAEAEEAARRRKREKEEKREKKRAKREHPRKSGRESMGLLRRVFGGTPRKAAGLEGVFTNSVDQFARTIGNAFHEIGDRKVDTGSANAEEELLVFALTFCTMMAQTRLAGDQDSIARQSDALNSSAIDTLVARGRIKSRPEFVSRLHTRYRDYTTEIRYEILGAEGKNEHGGPMFGFATVYSNAYRIGPQEAPLLAIAATLPVLMGALQDAVEAIHEAC